MWGCSHLLTSDPSLKAMEVGICPADRGVMGSLVRQIDSYTGSDLVVVTLRTTAEGCNEGGETEGTTEPSGWEGLDPGAS